MLPLLLSAALLAPADTDPVVTPKGVAPRIEVGQVDKDGKYTSEQNVVVAVPVTKEIEVEVNGRKEKRTITALEYQTRTMKVTRFRPPLSRSVVTPHAR